MLSMCSCGARKVNKSQSKEETKTELSDNSTIENKSETNVKTTTVVSVDDKNETVTEETTYEPVSLDTESYVINPDGSKTVFGNAKKTVKKTTKKNNTKSELVSKTDELKKETEHEQKDVKAVTVSKKENSSKQIDKKAFSPFNLLWFIIPICIIYVFYRIYKKLPLVPKL